MISDNGKQMALVGLMCRDEDAVVVIAIAEIVAHQILRLDAHVKLRVVEINGLVVRVVDGEVHMEGVARMENGSFGIIGIGDAEGGHQAVGRLEMLSHKSLKLNSVDVIIR